MCVCGGVRVGELGAKKTGFIKEGEAKSRARGPLFVHPELGVGGAHKRSPSGLPC